MHALHYKERTKHFPEIRINNLSWQMSPFVREARSRIFSLAAGNRIGAIAPRIMEIGYAKVLYAVDKMGIDVKQSKSFILFAPDGTCTYNPIRIRRGFTYGALIDMEFDGMMAVNNSMPNGCGYSMYELENPVSDDKLVDYLRKQQKKIGEESLSRLATGNHFAGVYFVKDPVTGEDTNRRFVVVHCSGHVDGDKLYHPRTWLTETEGFHTVETPHGTIELLEGEARKLYHDQFNYTNNQNSKNRDNTMSEIFPDGNWKRLEGITHQGLSDNGKRHHIGIQVHDGIYPIAFNPEEGLIAARTAENLNSDVIDSWDKHGHITALGIRNKLKNVNISPHGAGYEFRHKVDYLNINLDKEGISTFDVKFTNDLNRHSFSYFKEIREYMTYRRRNAIMKELYHANLAEVVYEMPGLMQVYPLTSIPGGAHN